MLDIVEPCCEHPTFAIDVTLASYDCLFTFELIRDRAGNNMSILTLTGLINIL